MCFALALLALLAPYFLIYYIILQTSGRAAILAAIPVVPSGGGGGSAKRKSSSSSSSSSSSQQANKQKKSDALIDATEDLAERLQQRFDEIRTRISAIDVLLADKGKRKGVNKTNLTKERQRLVAELTSHNEPTEKNANDDEDDEYGGEDDDEY